MYGNSTCVQWSSQPQGFSIRRAKGLLSKHDRSKLAGRLPFSLIRRPKEEGRALRPAQILVVRFREPMLPLGVLRRLAGTLEAVLLSLFLTGVAREKAVAPQRRLQ